MIKMFLFTWSLGRFGDVGVSLLVRTPCLTLRVKLFTGLKNTKEQLKMESTPAAEPLVFCTQLLHRTGCGCECESEATGSQLLTFSVSSADLFVSSTEL